MVLINALLAYFGIFAKFPRWKSGKISPYFHGKNSVAFCLRWFIEHKTLFSLRFRCENTATKVPNFHSENSIEFRVWCTMVHRQGSVPVYTMCVYMFILGRVKAHQSIKHVDVCRIHGETNVTSWYGSRQTYRDDHAHNIARIYTDSNCLECIPTLQGQEHPWSWEGYSHDHESPSYKVHNHPQASIYRYIHTHAYIMHNANI